MDSILIDEARTPLIISGKGKDSSSLYQSCQRFVRRLRASTNVDDEGKPLDPNEEPDGDYEIDKKKRAVSLTVNGIIRAENDFGISNLADAENSELNHYINNALRAYLSAVYHLRIHLGANFKTCKPKKTPQANFSIKYTARHYFNRSKATHIYMRQAQKSLKISCA